MATGHDIEQLLAADNPRNMRRRNLRVARDRLARYGIAAGGSGVIVAIALIFFYLLYVVFPLFVPADAERVAGRVMTPEAGRTLALAVEEQGSISARVSHDGMVDFQFVRDGTRVERVALPVGTVGITAVGHGAPGSNLFALGLADGTALLASDQYRSTYPDDQRVIVPEIEYPLGAAPVVVDPAGATLTHLAVQGLEDETTVAALTADGRLVLAQFEREASFLGLEDAGELVRTGSELPAPQLQVRKLLMDQRQRRLYVLGAGGDVAFYDIRDKSAPRLIEQRDLLVGDKEVTAAIFLTGTTSLLIGTSSGEIVQVFPVRGDDNIYSLAEVRRFGEPGDPAITALAGAARRKGFAAGDAAGRMSVYHTTAQRRVLTEQVSSAAISALALAPRANFLLIEDATRNLHYWALHNEHPEVSWASLWQKVWYEGYAEPDWVWQSSSASNDFEPKFSLTPLSFGTLKAAFYAMLFAVPIAIFGAIYTGYFMTARMRRQVKPVIEIMEALPTVILGFLAGLWLAPYLERHMPGLFSALLIVPAGVLLSSYRYFRLPPRLRPADGWEAGLLIPVILLFGWLAMLLSGPLEALLFGGDMPGWLSNVAGIDFDQRNSLVVGIAMGVAVIPTIFSIAEDAVFSVPRHLTQGSLALGATYWQTLTRVVILTASPGIFSALMIGLGRAVGETMIVLMATGNTPVMDFSIFQGMRTLSANIAVEMPESEVGSTHYRVLFLAGLVLFMFTFFVNTLAELVRQRLREKYSSL